MTRAGVGWFFGCHGVKVEPAEVAGAYGTTHAEPSAVLTIEPWRADDPAAFGPAPLWSVPVVDPQGGSQTHEMWQDAAGSLTLTIGRRPVLRIAPDRSRASVGPVGEPIAWQLVTTFALPLAAQRVGAFVLHASVAVKDGQAVVVCADSGTGKSSVLVALADAGWAPLTEDLVAVDLDAPGGPVAWPGPPWVRVAGGLAGPAGAERRFETSDKTGWDLGRNRRDTPVPIAHLVLLDPPGEGSTSARRAPPAEVIAALARHTPWFGDPSHRASSLFAPSVRLARAVPATRVRLQRSERWRPEAVRLMTDIRAGLVGQRS